MMKEKGSELNDKKRFKLLENLKHSRVVLLINYFYFHSYFVHGKKKKMRQSPATFKYYFFFPKFTAQHLLDLFRMLVLVWSHHLRRQTQAHLKSQNHFFFYTEVLYYQRTLVAELD